MKSAIIVSIGEKNTEGLKKILSSLGVEDFAFASNGKDVRAFVSKKNWDLCVINTPLGDEFGEKLAYDIIDSGVGGVILIVKAEIFEDTSQKASEYGIITLSKPLNRKMFCDSCYLLDVVRKKLLRMQNENKKMQKKIEDIKLLDRAKYILITYLSMTEPQAHKYMERQAMDMRITKIQVAQEILKTYDN